MKSFHLFFLKFNTMKAEIIKNTAKRIKQDEENSLVELRQKEVTNSKVMKTP